MLKLTGKARNLQRMMAGYFFVILSGALMIPLAFAESGTKEAGDTLDKLFSEKPNPETDLNVQWMEQMFGQFIYGLWGAGDEKSVGLLATVLGYTNVVALILGIGILVYVLTSGAINTASSGEVLGKKWSSVWLPLRTAMAFGLLLPVKGIGGGVLSAAQVFVVYLIMLGSSSATILWNKVIDQVSVSTPSSSVNLSGINASHDLFNGLVCAQAIWKFNSEHQIGNNYLAKVIFDDGVSSTNKLIPGPVDSSSFQNLSNVKRIDLGVGGVCGAVSFGDAKSVVNDFVNEKGWEAGYYNAAYKAGTDGIIEHLQLLSPRVKRLMSSANDGGLGGADGLKILLDSKNTGGADNSLMAVLNDEMIAVASLSASLSRGIQDSTQKAISGNKGAAENMTEGMKKLGWVGAGQWFFELSKFQNLSNSYTKKILASVKGDSGAATCGLFIFGAGSKCDEKNNYVKRELTAAQYYGKHGSVLAEDQGVVSKQITVISSPEDVGFMITSSVLNALAWAGEDDTGMAGEASVTSLTANPFMTVSAIGHGLNDTAIAIWSIGLVGSIAQGAGDSLAEVPILGAVTGLFTGPLGAGFKYILASLIPVLLALVTMGFVLAYLIPFMPVTLWVVMMAGYLLTVVEAIAATPLAVIMMATPEGEGIMGQRTERALALIAAIVLRPTLMVIGIVAAYFVCVVAFNFLNQIFWVSSERQFPGLGMLDGLAMIIIYTSTAYHLCKYSISIMHRLPDQILEWMSGGMTRSFGEQEIGGVMQQNMGQMQSVSGNVVQGATGHIQRQRAKKNAGDKNQQ